MKVTELTPEVIKSHIDLLETLLKSSKIENERKQLKLAILKCKAILDAKTKTS